MDDSTTREKAALRRAADVLGGQAALATACGYSDRRHVWPWFNNPERRVLPEKCPLIERATRIKAHEAGDPSLIVTCEELRPDVAWDVLRAQPDLTEAPRAFTPSIPVHDNLREAADTHLHPLAMSDPMLLKETDALAGTVRAIEEGNARAAAAKG